jgi:hypothetical protein
MEERTYKILTASLGISIVIAFIGLLFASEESTIVGAVANVTTGTANVTINQVTQITLVNNSINFGTGFVNSSGNNCTLFSNGTVASKPLACNGFNQPAVSAYFVVENNGNVNVTLQINGTFNNASDFLCNTAVVGQKCLLAVPEYKWDVMNQESGSCDDGSFAPTDFSRHLNKSNQNVCVNFDFNSSSNSLQLPVKIVIPRDSRVGTLNDTVSFIANTG